MSAIEQTLRALRDAAETHSLVRPSLYATILDPLPKSHVIAIAMVLAEGNRHGPDAARDLAGRLGG